MSKNGKDHDLYDMLPNDMEGRAGFFGKLPFFHKTGGKWGFRILVAIVLLIIVSFFLVTLMS